VIPEQLRYTSEHEWVAPGEPAATIGITDFAQDALGDIVYVQLPETGAVVTTGDPLGEVESTKSVSEVYAPFAGTVVARNEALLETPELMNSDPYGEGWLVRLQPADSDALDALLDAAAYQKLTEQ